MNENTPLMDVDSVPPATLAAAGDSEIRSSDDRTIQRLASLPVLEYERIRKEQAEEMKCRPAILDKLVEKARGGEIEADRLPFAEIEPYPEAINPALLLDEISETIKRFVVLEHEQANAAALWLAFTWFIDVVEVAPLAVISAPEPGCGKSQLLDLLGRMAAKPLPAANATTAALFRAVELWKPTVLIDEADTFIRENEELKGLVNAGHTRANAFVLRVVGDNHEPRLFNVWGAKAFAGIALEKHLPNATMSRAILFELRKKLRHEQVTRLRHAEPGLFDSIASKLARFALDYSQQIRLARPALPDELGDRAQDNWEPLLAIAGCAGTAWMQRAKVAALKLSGAVEKIPSTGNELLADIKEVFENKDIQKISTADLIAALIEDDEKSWATYNRGKPVSPRQIANRLVSYGIKSKTIRIGLGTPKGFERDQFDDAFARYLADQINFIPDPLFYPQQRNKSLEANNDGLLNVADRKSVADTKRNIAEMEGNAENGNNGEMLRINSSVAATENRNKTLKPAPDNDCCVVADKTGVSGNEIKVIEI